MKNNIYLPKDFFETEEFKSYGEKVQLIIDKLISILSHEKIEIAIKVGRGKNKIVTISDREKTSMNICTIYVHKEHIRVKIDDYDEVKITSTEEIPGDWDLILDILDKYRKINRDKKRYSIYVYSDIIKRIEAIANKEDKTVNEIIEKILDENTSDLFTNLRHKNEFKSLLTQADLFRDDLDYSEPKIYRIIAFLYLISAYQSDYKYYEGEKFRIEIEDGVRRIKGPIHLFDEWKLVCKDSDLILGFALYILYGSESPDELLDVILAMDSKPFKYAINSLKILKGEYRIDTISEEILTKPKYIVIQGGVL